MSFTFQSMMSRPAAPKAPTRRRSHGRRRALKPSRKCFDGRTWKQRRSSRNSPSSSSSKGVAERLEALKRLIPSMATGDAADMAAAAAVSPDRLFEEAADYILLLKTQVELLKHLVDLYSPAESNATVS